MNDTTQSWFQQQLNDEAKRIGKSATDRLAIEIPTLPVEILKYFYQEHSIQMAANVISNRMLQYFLEQITAIIESDTSPVIMSGNEKFPVKSLVDPETKEIRLSNIYADHENEVIDAVIVFLKIELHSIMEQQRAFQQQMQMQNQKIHTAGGMPPTGGIIR